MKINFAKHLLELLLEQGKVNVPGLGKFELIKKSASYGDGRKSLVAPSQEIVFTEEHDGNDTCLQDRISTTEESSIDAIKAAEFVNQFTSNVTAGLVDNNEVEVAYIGVIKRAEDGKVIFAQNQTTIDKLNKYLPELELPEPKKVVTETPKVQAVESVAQVTAPVAATSSASTSIRQDIQVAPTPPSYSEPEKSSLSWVKWLLPIVGFIVLCTMAFKMCGTDDGSAYRSNQGEDGAELTEANAVESGVDVDTMDTDSIGATNDELSEEQAETLTDSTPETTNISGNSATEEVPMKTAQDFNKKQCIVIIGSYQSGKNVRSATTKIKNKGYNIYQESHGAYTRVGVKVNCEDISGSYSDYVRSISREFDVTAWFLSPEVKQ